MNYIDIIILALLVWALVRGFRNGLFVEIASVAALILGIWGAIRFSGFTANKLVEMFDLQTEYLGLVAFLVTFIVIVIGVHFIANAVDKLMKAVALGFVVRVLGMVFAVIKTFLILSVLLVILETIDQKTSFLPREKINESRFYRPVADFAPLLFPVIEGSDLRKSFERLKPANRKSRKSDEIAQL